MTEYNSRVAIIVMAIAVCLLSWLQARRILSPWHRLPLDYTLGLFSLTYAAGCMVLFVAQEEYLLRYYGGSVFLPTNISYWLVLSVAVIPYLIVPWSVVILSALWKPSRALRYRPPLRPDAVVLGLGIVIIGSLLVVTPVAPLLISNALGDLAATTSQSALYVKRAEVFQATSFLQGAVIYSVLPPSAAIIMFWPSRRPWLNGIAGGALALLALLLNLGMFQIGPTLTFLLVCVFCHAALRGGRPHPVLIAGAVGLGSVAFGLYSLVKTSSTDLGSAELFIMRLPIPLPYLIQMSSQAPPPGSSPMDLGLDLGEYMFPQLRTAQRFVAMPQPGYIDAWFNYGYAVGIFVLFCCGVMITIFGNLLAQNDFGRKDFDPRLILWSVVAAPSLYYAFQVDVWNLFTSAFSTTVCLIPVLAILTLNAFMPPQNGALPALRQPSR